MWELLTLTSHDLEAVTLWLLSYASSKHNPLPPPPFTALLTRLCHEEALVSEPLLLVFALYPLPSMDQSIVLTGSVTVILKQHTALCLSVWPALHSTYCFHCWHCSCLSRRSLRLHNSTSLPAHLAAQYSPQPRWPSLPDPQLWTSAPFRHSHRRENPSPPAPLLLLKGVACLNICSLYTCKLHFLLSPDTAAREMPFQHVTRGANLAPEESIYLCHILYFFEWATA